MKIRNSAKAIIIQNGHLLCNKNKDERCIFYCVPGGGQDYQETIREAVARECIEEIDTKVQVGELLFVREYIGKNHPEFERFALFHQVEFFFACTLIEGETPALGINPDKGQIGVEWIPLAQLKSVAFFPVPLADWLEQLDHPDRPVYLGDVD